MPHVKPSSTVCGEKHLLQSHCGLFWAIAPLEPGAQGAQDPRLEKGARWRPYTPGAGPRASAPASAWLPPASELLVLQKHEPLTTQLTDTARFCSRRGGSGLAANPLLHCHLKLSFPLCGTQKPTCVLLLFLCCPTLRAHFLSRLNRFRSEGWSLSSALGSVASKRPRISLEVEAMGGADPGSSNSLHRAFLHVKFEIHIKDAKWET